MAKAKAAKAAASTAAVKTNQYEGMFLFGSGAATEPQAAEGTVRKFIEQHGGNILVLKKWDERKLAYEVNGNKRGTYFLALFTAPGGAVAQIERDVKLSEDVLRVMILKADHVTAEEIQNHEPQKPEPREERGFGGYGGGGYGGGGDRDRGGDRGDRGGDRGGYGDRGPRGPRREEAPAAEGAGPGDDK
jgi:small subunit ribosomal protein S6